MKVYKKADRKRYQVTESELLDSEIRISKEIIEVLEERIRLETTTQAVEDLFGCTVNRDIKKKLTNDLKIQTEQLKVYLDEALEQRDRENNEISKGREFEMWQKALVNITDTIEPAFD